MQARLARATMVLLALVAAPAGAQEAAPDVPGAVPGTSAGHPASIGSAGEARVAPGVVISGPPRSYQVVSIPVPEGIPRDRPIRYEILGSGLAPVLRTLTGSLPADSARRDRILLTVPLPATMRAGTVPVARVLFFPEGSTPVEVPVQVRVLPQPRLEIAALEALRAVRPGDHFPLTVRLTNLGNAPDTVEIRVLAAPGWRIASRGAMSGIPVGMRGVVTRVLDVAVPAGNSTGSAAIQLVALSHDRPLARSEVEVQLLEAPGAAAGSGPRLVTGAGIAAGSSGASTGAYGASLEGQLTSGLRVSARAAAVADPNSDAVYGLAKAGLFRMAPSLQLTAPAWGLGLGVTSARLTEQTGLNVGGQGAALDLRFRRWGASAYAGRPQSGEEPIGGALAGGRLDVQVGAATVTGSASHLVDEGLDRRQLDAVALGTSVPGLFGGVLSSELARRRYDGGSGIGWTAGYARRGRSGQIFLRLGHSPGGSAAFARATDEVQATLGQRLTPRLNVAGSMYRNADASRAGLTALVTSGWSLGGQIALSEGLTAGLTARRSHFAAGGAFGGFGSNELALDGSLSIRRRGVYGSVLGTLSEGERLTTAATGTRFREAGPRKVARAAVGSGGRFGVLEVTAAVEGGGAAMGYLGRQAEGGLRAGRVPLLDLAGVRLLGSASVLRRTWFGARAAETSFDAALTAEVPGGLAVTATAERNPFILTAQGIGGWFYALKVERTTVLPRLSRDAARGTVFRDLDGNGSRDGAEPGVAGVLVRSGSRSTVTAADGSYEFEGRPDEPLSVDAESLPMGWIVGKTDTRGGRTAIAIVTVASVEVSLVLPADAARRVPAEDLARAGVMAVDGKGRTWMARLHAAGQHVFDALPPGTYRIELDLSDLVEPLTPAAPLPEFTVAGRGTATRIEIPLRARPVKVTRLPQGSAP